MSVFVEKVDSCVPALIQAPVRLMLWTRPDFLKKQYAVIRQVRPKTLILVSDNGRSDEEVSAIAESRELFKDIDWECTVHRIFWNENQGMYSAWRQATDYIWGRFDRCIFLEDDDIPSKSFFFFCDEMLEKYKNDLRIQSICGMNSIGIYDDVSSDYFFSKAGSIWGIAFWKRTYDQFLDYAYGNDAYIMRCINDNLSKADKQFMSVVRECGEYHTVHGHIPGDEYYLRLATYLHHQLKIIPKKNLITNIGCDERGTHTNSLNFMTKKIQKLYYIPAYDYELPFDHPKYVIEDKQYEAYIDDIFDRGKPLRQKMRIVEIAYRKARYGGVKMLAKSIKKNLLKGKTIER